MSNHTTSEGNQGQQVTSGIPSTFSTADIQAAETLVSLSRGDSKRIAVAQPQSPSQYGNDQTLLGRLESISLTGGGVFSRPRQPPANSTIAAPSTSDPVAQLVKRLHDISLAHMNDSEEEKSDHRSKFGTLDSSDVIGYYRCSEVPEEVGRFVDLWDARGYTFEGILNMLLLNNVIVPHEYVYGRLAYGNSYTDSHLRSTFGGEWDAPSGSLATRQAAHKGGDVEMEGEFDDDDSTESWEDQIEQWCEWH